MTHELETLALIRRILATASVVCFAGAVLAYVTGDDVVMEHGALRTHMDAFFVLGTLSVALLAGAIIVGRALVSKRPQPVGRNYFA